MTPAHGFAVGHYEIRLVSGLNTLNYALNYLCFIFENEMKN